MALFDYSGVFFQIPLDKNPRTWYNGHTDQYQGRIFHEKTIGITVFICLICHLE